MAGTVGGEELMRRTLAVMVAVIGLGLMGCQPPPTTITATPSTLKPACKEVTTVTGQVTPVGALKQVVLEYQKGDGTWAGWKWFETGASDETLHVITKKVAANGTYSLTYYVPHLSVKSIRLRVRGTKMATEAGVASKSWYVNRMAC